jgi:predicted metal-binding membrane protein
MAASLTSTEFDPDRGAVRYGVPVALIGAAALGWWWSVHMAKDMSTGDLSNVSGMRGMEMTSENMISVAGFLVAWFAMMTAMMLPAILPVMKLYLRALTHGRVAPLPYFVAGYLTVWMVPAIPAYFAWRALFAPLSNGAQWAGRLAGVVVVAAGIWQLTPLKKLCLRHCRSPMSFFLRFGGRVERPLGAARMGALHGFYCFGCCWAIFALLVALGTMNLGWMLILTALIAGEKLFVRGDRLASAVGAIFLGLGTALFIAPGIIDRFT